MENAGPVAEKFGQDDSCLQLRFCDASLLDGANPDIDCGS